MDDNEIFNGKTLSDLFEDIYQNTNKKRQQLDELLKGLVPYLSNISDIEVIGPIIKDLMDVKVKNDEALIRMSQIAQRAMGTKSGDKSDFALSDEEKEQLLKNIGRDIEDLADEAQDAVSKLKK